MGWSRRTQTIILSSILFCTSALLPPSMTLAQEKDAGPAKSAKAKKAHAPKEHTLHAVSPGMKAPGGSGEEEETFGGKPQLAKPVTPVVNRKPRELHLTRAHSFQGDVRSLPQTPPIKFERPEVGEPTPSPKIYPSGGRSTATQTGGAARVPTPSAPAPAPIANFDGLDFNTWGAGHPLDQNGDVGPTYYVQTINTSIGIFNKSTGANVAAFTFNTFMSQGNFGNLCDTNNFGDPVVLYDSFEDRWIITDFAFTLSGGNPVSPAYECFAASKTGDPVSGGWNFYSIQLTDGLNDYPKFGIWPDGLYMSANMFGFGASGPFLGPRVWALNKQQMYAGTSSVQIVSFDGPTADFTVIPSDARLQTGTPPTGTPNYFVSTWQYLNALSVYKFHVDWNSVSLSTFSGPFTPAAATSWPNANVANAATPANALDVLQIRAMSRNQYSNIGGTESVWVNHTVRRADTTGFAAPRWYQVDVTGGTVAANLPQAATWDPDGANVTYRYIPSLAVDRAGDMAMVYTTSNSTTNPAIKYAGRLAGDPINTLGQAEQTLIQGTGTQSGTCGTTCTRWGDYTSMSLDPDGCTFWMQGGYFTTTGLNVLTRIGSFSYPSCSPVAANGTISGTVTNASTSAPINGATVQLGSRTATTDVNGSYSFTNLAPGIYPSVTASYAGFNTGSATSISVASSSITTQDFALTAAASNGCLTDTTQADFQAGIAVKCDLTGTPGDVKLVGGSAIDQQNTTVTNNGFGFTSTSWAGQTFKAAATGNVTRIDLDLFCSGCTGTTPDITVSLRATSGATPVPTGSDLATATITGFNSGAGGFYTATFNTPYSITAGTVYAVIFRANSNPSAGIYAYVCSCTTNTNPYADGQRVTSSNSGSTWTADTTTGGRDIGFKVFVDAGFTTSGTFTSSTKDANPSGDRVSSWGTFSWTADTPTNTSVKFQAAASNNINGPFSYVGPDGTASTYFSNGDSLSEFNGKRYLKYQATLGSTNSTVTSALHDVTVCFSDLQLTTLAVSPASGDAGGTVTLTATLTSGTGLSGKTVNFTLNSTSVGSAVTDGSGIATLTGVSLAGVTAGTYPGAVGASFAGDTSFNTSSGTATLTATTPATMSSPSTATPLPGSSVTFQWNAGVGATEYRLSVGSAPGGNDLAYVKAGLSTSTTVNGLPTNGSKVYVYLWSWIRGAWQYRAYTYTAAGASTPASITSPTPGSILPGSSATFNWSGGSGIQQYTLTIGSTPGAQDIAYVNAGRATSATVNTLPTDGRAVYVYLWSNDGTKSVANANTYTAFGATAAAVTSPTPGTTLSGGSATFQWSTGVGVIQYILAIGSTPGARDIAYVNAGRGTSATVNTLPTDGRKIYVYLYSNTKTAQLKNAYSYTTAP